MTSTSFPRLMRSLSRLYGPKTALAFYTRGHFEELSWCDLWSEAVNVATDLVRAGLPDEATVVIASPLSPGSIAVEVGVMTARGVACPLDPSLDHLGIEAVLKQAKPWAVFVSEDQRGHIERLGQRLSLSWRLFTIPQVLSGHGPEPNLEPALEARLESTGPGGHAVSLPRGDGNEPYRLVDFMHCTLTETASALACALGASEGDVWLSLLRATTPFARIAGLYAGLASGGEVALLAEGLSADPLEGFWISRPTIAVMSAADAAAILERVREETRTISGFGGWLARIALRVSGVTGPGESALPPRPWWREAARAGRSRLVEILGGRLRIIILEKGALDPQTAALINAMGTSVFEAFGPPEAAGLVTVKRLGEPLRQGSVGRPLNGVRLRISDEGEVLVSGHNVMLSYRMTPPNKNPALQDGWLRTGEIGRLDEAGWLYSEGREGPR